MQHSRVQAGHVFEGVTGQSPRHQMLGVLPWFDLLITPAFVANARTYKLLSFPVKCMACCILTIMSDRAGVTSNCWIDCNSVPGADSRLGTACSMVLQCIHTKHDQITNEETRTASSKDITPDYSDQPPSCSPLVWDETAPLAEQLQALETLNILEHGVRVISLLDNMNWESVLLFTPTDTTGNFRIGADHFTTSAARTYWTLYAACVRSHQN